MGEKSCDQGGLNMRLVDLFKRLSNTDRLRQSRLERVNQELTQNLAQQLAQQMFDEWRSKAINTTFHQILTGNTYDAHSDMVAFDTDKDIMKKYEIVNTIYLVIRKIAWKISTTPLVVLSPEGERMITHPLLDKLHQPNSSYSGVDLIERSVTYLEGLGKFLWVIDRNSQGKIEEITCPEAWKVEVVPSKDSNGSSEVGGFRIVDERGKVVRAPTIDEVVYVRYFHPTKPWDALPPIQSARMEIQTMISATVYNKAFFENSAVVNLFLETDKAVREDEAKGILSQFEGRHRSPTQAFKPALLPLGLKAKTVALSHQDMEFLAQDRNYRHKICSIFDTPLAVVGFYESDYSAARSVGVQNYMEAWWHNCLIPRMTKLVAALNRAFAKDLGEGYELAFDLSDERALQASQEQMARTAKLMLGTGVSIDEVRAMVYNLPPLDDGLGKNVYVPAGLVPVGSVEATSGDTVGEGVSELLEKLNNKVVTSRGLVRGKVDWSEERLVKLLNGG